MTPSPTPSLDGEAGEASLTDERILHLWDTHVAYETTPNRQKQPPLDDKDKIAFARAVLAAAIPALPPDTGKPVAPPEFQEVSWGVDAVMRPVKGMAISDYAFRQWAKDVGIVLAASQPACTNSQTALIRDLIGALQEVLPYLDDGRSQQERELGADVRNLIRQAQRESQPAPTPDAAPLSIEDAVALVRAKANAGYGYGPKGSRDEFDRCYSLSPLQLATVINAARAASMQDTSSPQSPQGGA